jgi:hypothetical protein
MNQDAKAGPAHLGAAFFKSAIGSAPCLVYKRRPSSGERGGKKDHKDRKLDSS